MGSGSNCTSAKRANENVSCDISARVESDRFGEFEFDGFGERVPTPKLRHRQSVLDSVAGNLGVQLEHHIDGVFRDVALVMGVSSVKTMKHGEAVVSSDVGLQVVGEVPIASRIFAFERIYRIDDKRRVARQSLK